MKTLIIVPAYNEELNIENVVRDIKENCPSADVLVVDDCSRDGTHEALKKLGIDHLSFISNLGIGGGVQAGYLYAWNKGYDIAVQFDGDGQHRGDFLKDVIRPIEESRAD